MITREQIIDLLAPQAEQEPEPARVFVVVDRANSFSILKLPLDYDVILDELKGHELVSDGVLRNIPMFRASRPAS